nr:hypothetical protein [Tanacetum cinerariifolium]
GGLKDKKKEVSMHQLALHLKQQPGVHADLPQGPTYELMRGSCNSLTELEYHLEEVYKATTDQLDWVNPEGQQYPHNLLQPLPLIPENRGADKPRQARLLGNFPLGAATSAVLWVRS